MSKYFDEFHDETNDQKCVRVRCQFCGFVRAKNTTRQAEHLTSCSAFLASTEGQQAVSNGDIEVTPKSARPSIGGSNASIINNNSSNSNNSNIWNGVSPNPNIAVAPMSQPRYSNGAFASSLHGVSLPARPPPSLASHLLNKWPDKLTKATQQPFLSRAGCGTLSAEALSEWLGQNSHISRAMIGFIGALIGKVRLPETVDSKRNTQYRALDLLVSTICNLRKELDFIETTKRKYGLKSDSETPSPITKAYVDLLASSSDSRASLIEGMVSLWITEHCYCVSWQYASTFTRTMPSSNYSVPSYLSHSTSDSYANGPSAVRANTSGDQHIRAVQDSLIPNWTSREFNKFVDACKTIVDELANAETTGSGKEQLTRCETQYQQVLYLWERIWPQVNDTDDGREPAEETTKDVPMPTSARIISNLTAASPAANGKGVSGSNNDPVDVDVDVDVDDEDDSAEDDEEDADAPTDPVDSPYGGTGLGAVAAANQVD